MNKKEIIDLAYHLVGLAIDVHKNLGPGLLESIYYKCLAKEFELNNIEYKSELTIPINYKGLDLDSHLKCDFFIENKIVVELKSVKETLPVHDSQLLTYMKLLKAPKGLLINFNSFNLYQDGCKTFVNNYFSVLK